MSYRPPAYYGPTVTPAAFAPPVVHPRAGLLTVAQHLTATGRTLVGHWDAAQGITLGTPPAVASWEDLTTGKLLVSAGTAPNYVASGGPNGRPYVGPMRESGTHRDLSVALSAGSTSSVAYLAVVFEESGSGTHEAIVWFRNASPTGTRVFAYLNSPGANQGQTFAGVTSSGNLIFTDGAWTALHSAHKDDSTGGTGDGETYFRMSGLESAANNTLILSFIDPCTLRIGSASDAANIRIAALWAWHGLRFSADDRDAVNPYLQAVYGVTL